MVELSPTGFFNKRATDAIAHLTEQEIADWLSGEGKHFDNAEQKICEIFEDSCTEFCDVLCRSLKAYLQRVEDYDKRHR